MTEDFSIVLSGLQTERLKPLQTIEIVNCEQDLENMRGENELQPNSLF